VRDDQQQALRDYTAEKRSEWTRMTPGNLWDADHLADDLERDARFAALDLCGFWNGPTASEVRDILLPLSSSYGWGPTIEVIADAVTLARDRCRSHRQTTAAQSGLVVAAAVAIVLWIGRRNG